MLSIILLIGGILALLFIVFGLLFEPEAVIALFSAPATVVRIITEAIRAFVQSLSQGCKEFFVGHTRRIPRGENDADGGPAHWFVSRFVYMCVAAFLVLATALLDIYRANAAQLQGNGGPSDLPSFLSHLTPTLLNGLIWSTLIAFWGIIALDVFEIVPPHARLLRLQPGHLRMLRWVVGIGAVVLCLTVGLLYYGASLTTHGPGWPELGDYVSAVQGVLINFAIFLALLAMVYGLVVIVLLGAGILWLVLSLIDLLLLAMVTISVMLEGLIKQGLEFVANLLRSAWNAIFGNSALENFGVPHLPRVAMGDVTGDAASDLSSFGSARGFNGGAQTPRDSDSGFGPYRVTLDDEPGSNLIGPGQTILLGIGSEAIDLLNATLGELKTLQATSVVRAAGISPIGARGESPTPPDLLSLGIQDIGVRADRSGEAQARASTNAGMSEPFLTKEQASVRHLDEMRRLMVTDLFRNAQQVCLETRRQYGQILIFLTLDNVAVAETAIAELSVSLEDFVIAVIATPPYDSVRESSDSALAQLRKWHESAYVATTVVVDSGSPLARAVGPDQQTWLVTKGLAGMICASSRDRSNASIGKALDFMGKIAPFTAIGVATNPVASGRQAASWGVLTSLFPVPRRGAGNPEAVRTQASRLIQKLLSEPSEWSINFTTTPPKDSQLISFITAPIRMSDRRWKDFKEQLKTKMLLLAPHMKVHFINGNGVADNQTMTREYYVQVSMLAGAPDARADQHGRIVVRPAVYKPVDEEGYGEVS